MDKWDGCFICNKCNHQWSKHEFKEGMYLCPKMHNIDPKDLIKKEIKNGMGSKGPGV